MSARREISAYNITLDGSAYVPAGADVTLYASENITADENFLVEDGADFYAHVLGDNEGTYQYDAIGNLVLNLDEGVKIEWTVYGKVREVRTRHDSVIVSFRYDAAGNRIEKRLRTLAMDGTGWSEGLTNYVRDASGNVMATYVSSPSPLGEGRGEVKTEQPIYGSTRLGMYKGNVTTGYRTLGFRDYELSNHLGNVLAGIKDNIERDGSAVDAVTSFTKDYYPFGLEMEGRTWKDSLGYRYGFNGKEKDDKNEWGNTTYDYGFRIYDPEIAKFLSVDPLSPSYPMLTPYQFASNTPIGAIDLDGLEGVLTRPAPSRSLPTNNPVRNRNRFPDRILTPNAAKRPLTFEEFKELPYGSPYNPAVILYADFRNGYNQYLDNYYESNAISNLSKRTLGDPYERFEELSSKSPEDLSNDESNELISFYLIGIPLTEIPGNPEQIKFGCENVARIIQRKIGGEFLQITNSLSENYQLGPVSYDKGSKTITGWYYHVAVVKDGMVYDKMTGSNGMPIEEYKKMFEYHEELKFEQVKTITIE